MGDPAVKTCLARSKRGKQRVIGWVMVGWWLVKWLVNGNFMVDKWLINKRLTRCFHVGE